MFVTPADFIDAKGGNAVVAKDVGVSEGAVALWKHRTRIPRAVWPDIMLRYEDVTLHVLLAIERGEPGSHGVSPSVDDPATLAPGGSRGAEKNERNLSRTGAMA
ncbi:hypothetical protein [uncultured Brevundimonas sp.]|uniref:hypothetical protein n=1 Tax=uncultured Brevundimonas sp. TaxID=213418 RepID=UPI0025E7FBDE|nr:hypothetical protein [uncultured Brevundimonas sp.]